MKLESETYRLAFEIEPRLVEECVLRAVARSSPEGERSFRLERDAIYEVEPEDVRESRFHTFHSRWFSRLHLGDELLRCLREHPSVAEGTSRCLVLPAVSGKEEGADLHEGRQPVSSSGSAKPVLVVKLRAGTLLNAEALGRLLRHELLHVVDMLDPEFGYQRSSSFSGRDPSYENLLRKRYSVLWDMTIDGRLAVRGLLSPEEEEEEKRRREFLAAFPMLHAAADEHFQRFFRSPRPSHGELVRFALSTEGGGDHSTADVCPLCRMPVAALQSGAGELDSNLLEAIQQDCPDWKPHVGLCSQCADLYSSRTSAAR